MNRLRPILVVALAAAACQLAAPGAATAAPGCLHEDTRVATWNRDGVEGALLCLTNVYRVRQGLPPYTADTRLDRAARGHSQYMYETGDFSHYPRTGTTPTSRAAAAGYPAGSAIGENIAYNMIGTARELLTQWWASEGHRANLLNPAAFTVGMGVADCVCQGMGGITGTQMFSSQGDANTGFTGLDLYVSDPETCLSSRAAARSASRAVARLKEALAEARTAKRKASLRKKVRRKRGLLQAARAEATTACAGQSP
jgi:uncharacterized protein YkwD